jgi:signal transduction histidine kinase
MKRFPLLSILSGMSAALALAVLYIIYRLQPPTGDVRLLVVFMSGSGLLTVLLAYLLYRRGIVQWFPSMHWSLLASVVITVVLIFVNVWFTAQLMFISKHDLVLTIALLLYAGLTALLFGVFIVATLTSRIDKLAQAARRLAEGKLDTRLAVEGSDEIAKLAETFNWMASSLQKLDSQKRLVDRTRRTLIAGVSHDLRTPLTTMRVMVEAIADGVVTDPDTVARYVRSTLSELQHLSRLIDDLFELAKLDAGQLELQFDMSSLNDLISDVLSSMSVQATQHHIRVDGCVNPDADLVYMAPDKIQRVIYNLLDNALSYTPPDGSVTINACRDGAQIRVDVHNTGSFIDPVHAPHVFESFYRGESSRVRGDDGRRGTGLGLAIARGFVEAHRGKIWVDSAPERGTTFSFTLPALPPDSVRNL